MNPPHFLNRSDAAALLRVKRSLIVREWETLVRKEVPAARAQDRPNLLDTLPDFIDGLDAALSGKETEARAPKEHARSRWRLPDDSLEAVIHEHHLLRRVLFDALEADAPLDREARSVIENRLDLAIEEAARGFSHLSQEDLRSVLSSAECLLWHAEVRELDDGQLHWDVGFFDPEGVRRKIPLKVEAGTSYVTAWHRSRLLEDRERGDREAIEAIRSGRDGYRQEFRHRLADGRIVWFLQRVNIERMAEKRWRLVGVCVDITERKRIEEERNNVLSHARCILWSAEVVRRDDENGPYLDWSGLRFDHEVAQKVLPLDVRRGEDYYLALWRSRNPEDNRRMGEVSRRAFFSGLDSYRQEYRCTDRLGVEHWLHEDVAIQPLEEGRWRATGVVTEITDRKHLELTLQERAEALAEADRRKDQFLTMLAHELRNPLSPILNAVHILRQTGLREPHLSKAREVIERQVRHQANLINDLLDAARIRSGKVDLRPERLDLARLVRDTTELHRGVFEEKGVALVLEIETEPLYARADPTRMAQVLANLLDNARKFTPSGESVTVRLTARGSEAQLSAIDTGIGIGELLLPRVFDTFSQADPSLDRVQGGLGLGLALVKGLVEAHHGTVIAESEGLGRGARFTVRLPAAATGDGAEKVGGPSTPPAQQRRILVIEDNSDAAQSMRDLLTLYGHEAQVAYDGPDGLRQFERGRAEVVVCDIGLPGMDGFEVARQIRRKEKRPTCLIALTGYGGEEIERRAAEAGFDAFLTKPVSPESLLGLLADVPPREKK